MPGNSRDTILISVSALFSSLVSAAGEYDPTVLQAARQNHRALRVVRSAHGGVGSRSPLLIPPSPQKGAAHRGKGGRPPFPIPPPPPLHKNCPDGCTADGLPRSPAVSPPQIA